MKERANSRTIASGAVLLALMLATTQVLGPNRGQVEPAPVEEMIEELVEEGGEVKWDLTVTSNERVEYWIDFLKGRNYEKTRLWLERSGRYAPMIRQELRARGMPEDLVYLALIERLMGSEGRG